MGWGKILGAIGGIAAAPFTGGASLWPTIISAGAGLGEAALSAHAEKKAAKQQVAGATQANERFSPYNTLGLQSANTLAGLLGLPGLPGGVPSGGAAPMAQPMTAAPVMPAQTQPAPRQGATLAQVRSRPPLKGGPMISSYGGGM